MKEKKKINWFWEGIIFLFLSGVVVGKVNAQTVTKVTAIPYRVEITTDPGEVVTKQLKVRNEGDTQIGLQVKIQDFVVNDKEGTPYPVEAKNAGRWAASQWITVSPQKFILNPGETKTLDFVAIVPEDAHPGGHYAVVFYAPVGGNIGELEGETTGASAVTPSVGTLVYFNVKGEIKEDARVTRFEIPRFLEYGPVKITTEIQNFSDIHIKPLGVIRIYDMLGHLRTTLKLDERNIFPGASLVYQNTWKQKWGLGKYKATLEAGYGTQGKALVATAFFWIIPWRVITVTVLVIILAVLLVIYFKKPKEIKEEETPPLPKNA